MVNRNMALNVIENHKKIPQSIIDIMGRNRKKEPNKGVLERYEKLLQKHKEQLEQKQRLKPCGDESCSHKWHLQVWENFIVVGYGVFGVMKSKKENFQMLG